MLDRTAENQARASVKENAEAEPPRAAAKRDGAFRRLWRSAWAFFVAQSFSSLTRRIVFLNLTGLVALLVGVMYLSQFRAGLIDARVQSLVVQSEIIAGAIAASATVETDSITIDPDRLLELQAGESYGPDRRRRCRASNSRSIPNVSRRCCAVWYHRPRRARIYDRDGVLILDSRNLYGRGDVLRFDLPSPTCRAARLDGTHFTSPFAAGSVAAICRSTTNSVLKTARAIRKSRRR